MALDDGPDFPAVSSVQSVLLPIMLMVSFACVIDDLRDDSVRSAVRDDYMMPGDMVRAGTTVYQWRSVMRVSTSGIWRWRLFVPFVQRKSRVSRCRRSHDDPIPICRPVSERRKTRTELTGERHGMSECRRGLSMESNSVLLLQLISATQTDTQVHHANQTRDENADHDRDEDVEVNPENDRRFCFRGRCVG